MWHQWNKEHKKNYSLKFKNRESTEMFFSSVITQHSMKENVPFSQDYMLLFTLDLVMKIN